MNRNDFVIYISYFDQCAQHIHIIEFRIIRKDRYIGTARDYKSNDSKILYAFFLVLFPSLVAVHYVYLPVAAMDDVACILLKHVCVNFIGRRSTKLFWLTSNEQTMTTRSVFD